MRLAIVPTKEGGTDTIKAYEGYEFPWSEIDHDTIKSRKKKGARYYCKAFGAFDIESTTVMPKILGYNRVNSPIYEFRPYGFMYHWQICIDGVCAYGRYWYEFIAFLETLVKELGVSPDRACVCYIHNAAYEYEFMHNFLRRAFGELTVFATHKRKPIKITCANGLEFRCSYFMSNMSLYKATTNELGVTHIKAKGDLDFKKQRTPSTYLDDIEFGYCIGDVISLWEYVKFKLINEGDTIISVPVTSTGFVRRDCRNAVKGSKSYRYKFRKMRLTPKVYTLLKEAGRGGNTHACRWLSGRILENVYSFDEQSAYPAMQLLKLFPMSKFFPYGELESMAEFEQCLDEYCCLFRVVFENIRLKERVPMPYIPYSKATTNPRGAKTDNGRILSCNLLTMTLTEIDYEIIKNQYEWDNIAVSDLHIARKGYLPKELTDKILEYFIQKSELKEQLLRTDLTVEEKANIVYLYMKSKNRLNGIFGMTYSDICHAIIEILENGEWKETPITTPEDIEKAINDYYDSPNSFLYYAWGVYTTAHARAHLQVLIDATSTGYGTNGEPCECIYSDTDSSKCINPNFELIEKLNQEIIKQCEERGAYADVNGHRYYLGIYENETDDKPYSKFVTLGAKKYAYVEDEELHITISGVRKEGAKELGSIENFKPDFTFYESAGSTLYYNDTNEIYNITINGETFETSSNIGMVDSTYTIGITSDYEELIGYRNILMV